MAKKLRISGEQSTGLIYFVWIYLWELDILGYNQEIKVRKQDKQVCGKRYMKVFHSFSGQSIGAEAKPLRYQGFILRLDICNTPDIPLD